MSYNHLTIEERYLIHAHKTSGKMIPEIAQILGRNKTTVYREIGRNTGGRGYRPKQADQLASRRQSEKPKAIKMTEETIALIDVKIKEDWSPEQISGRLFNEEGISISPETIYQHILKDKAAGGVLHSHLRCQKKNKKRYGTKPSDKRGQIKNKVSIEERPQIVEDKTRKGDWEGDLIIGKNHKRALVTLADRKTKKVKIAIVDSKHAGPVSQAIIELLAGETKFTVTLDNGKEFAGHETIKDQTGAAVYFAHPYSSWERGLNENTNGLIRQYFPKGSCFEHITDEDVRRVENILNNRPRKTLGFLTPNEVYSGERRVQYE
jgi:IS30 family transposase